MIDLQSEESGNKEEKLKVEEAEEIGGKHKTKIEREEEREAEVRRWNRKRNPPVWYGDSRAY